MILLSDIDEIRIEPTTDASLRAYSHSMLNSIATCPTKGLVNYHANKVMAQGGRAMALEAGSAAHEAYAAARVWQLWKHQGLDDHARHHGERLFGERFKSMVIAAQEAGEDKRAAMLRFCLEAFYTAGFYDDPADKRRTFTNIEEALIAYLDRFDFRRNVWVADRDDPTAPVGIEIPIDVTLTYVTNDGEMFQLRFIGTADGVTVSSNGDLRLEENKTASRLGEAWSMSFHTSHQQTGYMIGLSTMLGQSVSEAAVHGMCIPLPRSYDAGGLMTETVRRTPAQMQDFLSWVLHIVQIIDMYGDDPVMAPKYTGACNKYFRPCSLIPLCASDEEDRRDYFDMMADRELSPTEKAMEDVDSDA